MPETPQAPFDDSAVFEPDPALETATHVDGLTVRHGKTGAYFALNATGGFLWTLLGKSQALVAVKESAAAHYGAPRETIDPAVDSFVGSLVSEGLLIPKPVLQERQ